MTPTKDESTLSEDNTYHEAAGQEYMQSGDYHLLYAIASLIGPE